MLVIIEGLEGTGKTTQALRLCERTGAVLYKPFRGDHSKHWGDGTESELLKLGIPVNSYVEDMFMADALATFKNQDAVLDRGMPSAYAYGMWHAGFRSESIAAQVFNFWLNYLAKRSDASYVYLKCDPAIAEQRSPGRIKSDDQRKYLEYHLDWCYQRIQRCGIGAYEINTDVLDIDKVAFEIYLIATGVSA
jgi:thymidylate kinase